MAEDQEELEALQQEYEWILRDEVHDVLKELEGILSECCRRFPLQLGSGENNLVKPEKFLLSSPNGAHQIKCMATLMGDVICEADLLLRIHRQQPVPLKSNIYPDGPWKIQQIQDAGNHLCHALSHIHSRDRHHQFTSSQEVIQLIDNIIGCLKRGRTSLALPKKKTLEELIKNQNMKCFRPSLPNDTVLSFYVQAQKLVLAVYQLYVNPHQKIDVHTRHQAQKLVLAVYQLYVNPHQKIDVHTRHQAEVSVPWLNDTLVLFTLALQQCQQLRDKASVFLQYEEENKLQTLSSPVES